MGQTTISLMVFLANCNPAMSSQSICGRWSMIWHTHKHSKWSIRINILTCTLSYHTQRAIYATHTCTDTHTWSCWHTKSCVSHAHSHVTNTQSCHKLTVMSQTHSHVTNTQSCLMHKCIQIHTLSAHKTKLFYTLYPPQTYFFMLAQKPNCLLAFMQFPDADQPFKELEKIIIWK